MIRIAIATVLPIGAIASALAWTVALRAPYRAAPSPLAARCLELAAAASPLPRPVARPEPAAAPALARLVTIFDAVDVQPPSSGFTTFSLPHRASDAVLDVGDEVAVHTRCDDHGCIDGLFDRGKVLIAPRREPDEQFDRGAQFAFERVVHVIDRVGEGDKLSVYVATSEYSGGAHANNALECRTYSRTTGRRLRLRDVMPPRAAALLLAKVRVLRDPDRALDEAGVELPEIKTYTQDVDDRNFRIEQRAGRDHLVVCVSSYDGLLLELRADVLPGDFLLH